MVEERGTALNTQQTNARGGRKRPKDSVGRGPDVQGKSKSQ